MVMTLDIPGWLAFMALALAAYYVVTVTRRYR